MGLWVTACTWNMRGDRHEADGVVVVPGLDPAVGMETGAAHRAPHTTAAAGAETGGPECRTQRSTGRPETQSTAALWRI